MAEPISGLLVRCLLKVLATGAHRWAYLLTGSLESLSPRFSEGLRQFSGKAQGLFGTH